MTRLPQPSPALSGAFALALALLFAAMLAFAPAPAAAQADDYNATTKCVTSYQTGMTYVYTNNCSHPITVAYCVDYESPCDDAGIDRYSRTSIGAGSSTNVHLNDGARQVTVVACTDKGELYRFGGDPFFGLKPGYRCRANAASLAKQQAVDDFHGSYAGIHWSVPKVRLGYLGSRECTAILNHGALGLDPLGKAFTKERYGSGSVSSMEWSGTCDADGLISGSGILSIILNDEDQSVKEFEGVADRGVLTGNGRYYPSDYDEDPGSAIRFDQGCNNWNGVRPNSCDPARGVVLRQQYLASRGPAPKPVTQPATAAKPVTKPVATAPAPQTDVSTPESRALNAQQAAAAADWLRKDTEAKRIQAEKVAEFERKQADFKRQQDDYARQQSEYKAALAAQQAEAARVAKANADAQACYEGDKTRCR